MRFSIISLATFFCVGIIVSFLSVHASSIGVTALLIVLVQLGLIIFASFKKIHTKIPLFIFLSSLAMFFGIVRGEMHEELAVNQELFHAKNVVQGEVIEPSVVKDQSQRVVVGLLDGNSTLTQNRIEATLPLYPSVYVGERYTLSGEIKRGEIILPLPPTTYTSFNYGEYLERRGIAGTMTFPKLVKRDDEGQSFRYLLYDIREYFASKISHVLPMPESALANGILFGKDELPKEENDAIRIAGLSHITVLSGFNVTVLVVLIMYLLRLLPLSIRVSLSALLISLFVLATGGGASLVRASIMAYVALLALYLGRPYEARYALFFSMFVFALISPEAIVYDVSLHLSFLATLGLLMLDESLSEKIKSVRAPVFLKTVFTSSLAVLIYTTPYLVHTFSQLSLYSILANIFAVPVVAPLMGVMSIYLLVSFIPVLSTCIGFIGYTVSSYILFIAHTVSSLPFASVPLTLSSFGMCLCYVVVAGITIFLTRKKERQIDDTIVSF